MVDGLFSAALGLLSVLIASLPLYTQRFETLQHRFLTVLSLSFLLPAAAFAAHKYCDAAHPELQALHRMLVSMVAVGLVAYVLEKPVFFWGLFAVPLSVFAFLAFWDVFALDFGAVMGCVVLVEAFVYTVVNGNTVTRFTGVAGLISAVTAALYFYPFTAAFIPKPVFLVVSYVLFAGVLLSFYAHEKDVFSVSTGFTPRYGLYVVFGFALILVAAVFQRVVGAAFLLGGVLSLGLLTVMVSVPREVAEYGNVLAAVFVVAAVVWLGTAFTGFSLTGGGVRLHVNVSALQLAVLAGVQLYGLKLVADLQRAQERKRHADV